MAAAGLLALGCFGVLPLAVRLLAGSSPARMSVGIALGLLIFLPIVWMRRELFGVRILTEALRPGARSGRRIRQPAG